MSSNIPVLTTERLLLTIPGSAAASAHAQFYRENREHLAPWSPPITEGHTDEAAWRSRLDADVDAAAEGRAYRFCIFEKSRGVDGPVLGHVNFTNIVRGVFLACNLGYQLAQAQQGKGYMTEACSRAIAFAFEEAGLHRVMANYMPSNVRSAAVLHRLGFSIEGRAKAYLYLAGAWQDHVLTSLVNPKTVVPAYAPSAGAPVRNV